MLMNKKMLREERGSMTLEFLMVFPYYLFFFLILWQVVVSGITFMKAQSAVNEAAKIVSMTGDLKKGEEKAWEIMGPDIRFYTKPEKPTDDFEAIIKFNHSLVFIPTDWRKHFGEKEFSFSAHSKVIK